MVADKKELNGGNFRRSFQIPPIMDVVSKIFFALTFAFARMASLSSCIFPLEIISLILHELSDSCEHDDLLSCRLVCKPLENLATPHAFRVITLFDNKDSRAAFSNIVDNTQLAQLVETINFTFEDLENDDNDLYRDYSNDGSEAI